MADDNAAAKRVVGLTKLFHAVIFGHRELKSTADANRFMEALCAQADVSKCVEQLIAAPNGLAAIAKSFRTSASASFLNGPATFVLHHLCHPSVKQLHAGQFLLRILEQIVEPPTFWNTFVEAHNARTLTIEGIQAFAWLLLEVLQSRSEDTPDVRDIAQKVTDDKSLTESESLDVRNLGQKIKHVLESTSNDDPDGPGGRHDNDFADFRKVKILPTSDEFVSKETPFYRRANDIKSIELENRGSLHLDNSFRLLREDLLGELRSDFQIATGQKKGRRKIVLEKLRLKGIECGTINRRKPCSLVMECTEDIPQLRNIKEVVDRKRHVTEKKSLLKHQALGCLISSGSIVAFASVDRNEDLLAKRPSSVVLRVADALSLSKVLSVCKTGQDLNFVVVDTAVFAYEPILKCLQTMNELPLEDQILNLTATSGETLSGVQPDSMINKICENWEQDLQDTIGAKDPIKLDQAQAESLLAGLGKRLSMIQGPPGTGKSFIGALIAKILHDHTKENILILSYTNHALDQMIVDIQRAGISSGSIVRLGGGGKNKPNTQSLSVFNQPNTFRMSGQMSSMWNDEKRQAESYHDALIQKLTEFLGRAVSDARILDFLEFSDDSEYFDAFAIPENDDDMIRVGKNNKEIERTYLIRRWCNGADAGIFDNTALQDYPDVWSIDGDARQRLRARWEREFIEEQVAEVSTLAAKYDESCNKIQRFAHMKDTHIISNKRIVACTTTGAAKYTEDIQKAAPGIVLVEEAGEILESHILTAMTPATKQLILIGDHKQLRPKVNKFALTAEKGDGYDLNVSLFERLVLAGAPHTTLKKQHRMRPEISTLVRSLTYPELEDAEKTMGRPNLRGFQDNVIFVSHSKPELNAEWIADRRDEDAKTSKENAYEADMVLKCVRYLGQQGYGTEDIVILTPYLGQLSLLVKTLAAENDPHLNDLDSYELIRAGLLSPAAAGVSKRTLRISTIDNYQGEESDIVIVCLTRSNGEGDIGFMSAPQRVNVLLSRARNALIMIGNAETFMKSHKGQEVWVPLMEQLKHNGHVYDGFPIQCEQHPDKKALLTEKEHFDQVCPDGGCAEPCGKLLACETHTCPHRCHQLSDHSKMECNVIVTSQCPKGHKVTSRCHEKASATCGKCAAEVRAEEERKQRNFKLDQERQANQRAYAARLAEIEGEIQHQKTLLLNRTMEQDRQNALAQKKEDLDNLKRKVQAPFVQPERSSKPTQPPNPAGNDESKRPSKSTQRPSPAGNDGSNSTSPTTSGASNSSSPPADDNASDSDDDDKSDWDHSDARDDWEDQKQRWGADNQAVDELMQMIGLETVKEKFLAIKNKVDTLVRQNVPLTGERFGAALLGNPGTGKTTVARLYAKVLMEVGALPGDHFFESSGSSLASDGIAACKKHIENILKAGGGVFFIDEAYQLVSGNSPGGNAVLDYFLAEIENLTGKVVFVLAGYHKQMETFFAHNPGIPSRIPIRMEFQDYSDKELHRIFIQYVSKKYKGAMQVEDGMMGLYVRIVARRIGRGRGRDGFGNARDMQNKISHITERQAKRLRKARKAGKRPDDFLLTKEDLIGPEPSVVLKNNPSWLRLQKMIGLTSVKQSIQILLDGLQFNYKRELQEKPLIQYSLNRAFIGSPGTGKTGVAKLYGRILAGIGLLSDGEVVLKNPADLIDNVIGGSEAKTKAALASSIGKVLIIDEAYMLGTGAKGDPYKAAIIDTIVAEVQSVPGEDRCVLLLGYKDQMEEMFRDVNPGLARRFPLASAFVFEDFDDNEIRLILNLKLKDIGFGATDQAKNVAMDVIRRARNRPNFGNAGEVDIILDKAKALHQKHMKDGKVKDFDRLEAIDFDPDFDRVERAATNVPVLFQGVVACENLVKQFQGYQTTAANMKALDMDAREQLPFNFLFKGPPGTGKTTTAQKMGKIFYDMGFLSEAKVEECSATDLIGQYVGHTGPKVQKLLEKAMGKVLFIDEAYRLGEGLFATEAMDELVDCLTKPKFEKKLIVILAGYDKDIDRLMSLNPGLTSRFPETVIFKPLDLKDSLGLMIQVLVELRDRKKAPLDLSVLMPPSTALRDRIIALLQKMSSLDSWGNARDVKSLARKMFGELLSTAVKPLTQLVLTDKIILNTMDAVLAERSQRNKAVGTQRFSNVPRMQPPPQQGPPTQPPPQSFTKTATKAASPLQKAPPAAAPPETKQKEQSPPPKTDAAGPPEDSEDPIESILNVKRDPGVSDAIWDQLIKDKETMVAKEREFRRLYEEKIREEQRIADLERAEKEAADEEERRIREQERIEAEIERRRKEAELAAFEEEREKERQTQQKLKMLGPCPMGYQWIKQSGGYRCAGGSHFLTDAMLATYGSGGSVAF